MGSCAGAAALVLAALCLGVIIAIPATGQTFTTIHNFQGNADGEEPNYGLTIDANGNLYGTTFEGDTGTGTVYQLQKSDSGWTLNPLYWFTGGTDGSAPYDAVIFGPDGNLYGTTGYGGVSGPCFTWGNFDGCGVVYSLTTSGQHHALQNPDFLPINVLYNFTGYADGANPYGGRLIFDNAGNLYGTADNGGGGNCNGRPDGCGVVYKLTPSAGGGWTQTVLYTFTGGNDGAHPWAGVTMDAAGNLYGTTLAGGTNNDGTVYELSPSGSSYVQTTLHSFQNQQDGEQPYAGMIFDSAGNMYGATSYGGANNGGTVFEMSPSGGGWTFTTIYNFTGSGHLAEGPVSNLVFDSIGNLYGATSGDGALNFGSVFELSPNGNGTWNYSSLHDFTSGSDGQTPRSNLVFDKNGNLYGTAAGGLSAPACGNLCGLVWEISFPQQFVPISACRVVDTRNTNGQFGGPAIQGGTARSFVLPQNSNCPIPTTATAYSLNVTVVPQGSLGYLTVWPTGEQRPTVSTMNSLDGRIKANAAIVPAGLQQAVSVYASNTTDVVLDIDGYFTVPGANTLQFYPLTPCRVFDTRNPSGDLGGPYLMANQERDFPVLEATCHIPSTAKAYSLNFTAVPYNGGALGYLTAWATGQSQPMVSTLNNLTATVVANAAIVQAGAGGEIAVYPSSDTNLVADINGYFAPPGTGGLSLYSDPPCRVLDTRNGIGTVNGELTVDVENSPCQPPAASQAYTLNATVVPIGSLAYLTLWPDSENQPVVSTLNAMDGAITSNMAIVPTVNGKIDAYAAGQAQLVLDISSYFAP